VKSKDLALAKLRKFNSNVSGLTIKKLNFFFNVPISLQRRHFLGRVRFSLINSIFLSAQVKGKSCSATCLIAERFYKFCSECFG